MIRWQDIDPDDIPGYLIDHVASWLKKRDVSSINEHYESYQMNSYRDDLEKLVDDVVEAVLTIQT